ncbi:MAG TPA: sulfotransferase domain-containing protein, partial [Gammaproteobacteria bacterium]|nr:sulfotransferase domain-containing protein [Gammaproteobacteria bacterium]
IPHLEEVGGEAFERLPPPRILKTHLPFSMVPHSDDARYLYVARNPFDCAVSFFHHTRGFVRHYDFADGTFDDYFECFLAGEVDFGDYFDNLLSWQERRRERNVLVLTYEGMSADPRAAVLEIGRFMGADCVLEETIMNEILRHSSFASMSQDQQRWSSRRPDGMPAFIRKGVVGDWINHFSPVQAQRLLAKADSRLAGSGIEALWPEIFAAARRFAGASAIAKESP